MAMKPPVTTSNYEPVEAGVYAARLYSIIEIGTVGVEWQGQMKFLHKVRLTFELPTELKEFKEGEGEKPYVLSQEFTYSMSEKANLRKFLEGWRGKRLGEMEAINTDLEDYMGKEGMLNVVHSEGKNGNTYANIQAISPMPKGMTCPPAFNKPFILNYSDRWDEAAFEALPDFLKDKMRKSEQYMAKYESHDDEDIQVEPFNTDEIMEAMDSK